MKKIIFLFFSLLLCTAISFAQKGTITGTVKSTKGEPLAKASVIIKGSSNGTSTDENGSYTIKVDPGTYTVVISFVGYEISSSQVTIAAGETVDNSTSLALKNENLEIKVVGSRSRLPRTIVSSPVPVDIIPVSQIANEVGQVDLNQILTFVAPSFQSARQTIADGTDHVDPAQLRGLGTDQVLVLVNGKRRHQSALVNVNGTVNRGSVGTDMSAIPVNAIERIEILRDGAAAQYGSDAIAGVVNIVLKKKINYLDANVSYGFNSTKYAKNLALYKAQNNTSSPDVRVTDGNTFQSSLNYGLRVGEKGFLNLTGEYTQRAETNRAGTYTGALYANVGGVNKDDSILAARGLTRNNFDMRIGNSRMKGGGVMYNFMLPLKDNKTEIYSFGGFGKKTGNGAGFFRYPSSVAGTGGSALFASTVFAFYPNGFLPEIESNIKDISVAVGVRTVVDDWNLDISNTYGSNKFDFNVLQSISYSQASVTTRPNTSFNAGGLQYAQNTVNMDISHKYAKILQGLNVAFGTEFRTESFDINSGEAASTFDYNGSPAPAAGSQVFAGFINTIGGKQNRRSIGFYSDNELDITKNWLLTGALRFESFNDFGNTLNYKVSTRYKIGDNFNLRASTSTGFRAPSMQQKYYTKTNTLFVTVAGNLVPVESGTFTNDSKPAQILGIPKLKQETSVSYSVGFTAKPFKGFEATVDAYRISIDNRIVLTNNFSGGSDPALTAQLNAAGASAANFFSNSVNTKATGLEAVLAYSASLGGGHSLRTILAGTFIKNEVEKDANGKAIIFSSPTLAASGQLGNYFNREDQSRIEVANPVNKISITFNYKYQKFSAMLRLVNFGEVTYLDPTIDPNNPAAFPINTFTGQRETLDQVFSPKTVTDLSLSYAINKEATFTVGANNLFDVYQDKHTHSTNAGLGRFVYSRRVQQMGFNGAYYFARLKVGLFTNK
jgi:iron complex outermembrane recepter protein